MTTTGAEPWIADLYDAYVTTTADVPFFLAAARAARGPVLELMAGTGRVSLPLAEANVALTCVDLSGPMLARLRAKLAARNLIADTVETNVRDLDLPQRDFALAILPFQSFAELIEPADQRAALAAIRAHLRDGGRFICTLHNPPVRRRSVDGGLRLLGTFPLPERNATLKLWSRQQLVGDTAVVRAMQFYEIYDGDGHAVEKRRLDARFVLIERAEFEAMARETGFSIAALYGDYTRIPFDDATSPYMIWVLER